MTLMTRDARMPRKRFTDEQIAVALRQADGDTPIGEICRKMGVSEATFYRWKRVDAGMGVAEIRRLKQLEYENGSPRSVRVDNGPEFAGRLLDQ